MPSSRSTLGVTTRGVFNVAATNAYSITLVRAIVALLACLTICALLLGRRMFRIARGDARTMVCAGLLMALLPGGSALQFLIVRLEKWAWMLLDRERSRLTAELCLLPGAATGAAECSGTAAESIALLDTPVTDRSAS